MVAGGEDAGDRGGGVRLPVVALPPPDGGELHPSGMGGGVLHRPVVHALRQDMRLHQLVIGIHRF